MHTENKQLMFQKPACRAPYRLYGTLLYIQKGSLTAGFQNFKILQYNLNHKFTGSVVSVCAYHPLTYFFQKAAQTGDLRYNVPNVPGIATTGQLKHLRPTRPIYLTEKTLKY